MIRLHTAPGDRRTLRRLVVAAAVALPVVLLAAFGAAAADSLPNLGLSGGQSGTVSCSGAGLSVTRESATQLSVSCNPSPPPPPPVTPPSPTWWSMPTGYVSWQWVLDHPLSLNSPADMGTTDPLPDGSPAPAPTVFDIDGIINPASTVAALHTSGDHVICYVEAGSAGNYYSASQEGVATTYYDQLQAAGALGNTLPGYPAERFVNISSPVAVGIIEATIRQQCGNKGFDAVETDLDETYSGYDGPTGLGITKSDEQTFLTTLANFIHGLNMGWIAKNLVDTGDNFATIMQPLADGLLTENCNQWNQCGQAGTYIAHGKGVLNAEFNLDTSQFCPADSAAGIDGAQIGSSVSGFRRPCR
jgi:Glycoside-hydrolase family GH114